MAKMRVVTRMVASDPTRALRRITTPVVLVSLPRPNGNATVTGSSLAQMNQSIRPSSIAVPISRR